MPATAAHIGRIDPKRKAFQLRYCSMGEDAERQSPTNLLSVLQIGDLSGSVLASAFSFIARSGARSIWVVSAPSDGKTAWCRKVGGPPVLAKDAVRRETASEYKVGPTCSSL